MVNLGSVHTKCDAATKTQYFPFIYSRTLYTIVALVVHTSSNNFHHKTSASEVELDWTFWSLQCASHSSCQSQVSAVGQQCNYTTQSHTVNPAMLITWDSLPRNHHTTGFQHSAWYDMWMQPYSFVALYSFLSLYLQMCIPMMRMTWYWTPSYQSTCLTSALTWWPWRRQVWLIHNSKLIISLTPLHTRFISGCTAIGRRQNCLCTQLDRLVAYQRNEPCDVGSATTSRIA